MNIRWLNAHTPFDRLILAGDIGGTNTNLGLVAYRQGHFSLILETVFPSQKIDGLDEPIRQTLQIARERRADLVPDFFCISAAGPVSDNTCKMTNLSWGVDGHAIARNFSAPTLVINDFLAISYGVLTLDVHDPNQIHPIAHPDGSIPEPRPANKAVIGPGTGMGVSFLVFDNQRHIPSSSEGGHIAFAPFDDQSASFRDFMTRELGAQPGVEPLVSGTGIANMYRWWKATYSIPDSPEWQAIDRSHPSERPRLISALAEKDPTASAMITLFVKMLARFASDVAALTLPMGGLYLAGGVAQKQLSWLEKNHLFSATFEENYNPNLRALLKQIPLYLIKDYSISLYGAANAGVHLLK